MPSVQPRARPDLSRRDAELRELMDDPCCDLAALRRTYARFDVVNTLVAGWSTAYRAGSGPWPRPAGR